MEEIRGGWQLINHAYYRELASGADRASKGAERQRRHREKTKRNALVTPPLRNSNTAVTPPCQADTEYREHRADTNTHLPPKSPKGEGEGEGEFDPSKAGLIQKIVAAYPMNGNAIEAQRALAAINPTMEELHDIMAKVKTFAAKMTKLSAGDRRYCPGKPAFFEGRRWNDNPWESPWAGTAKPTSKFSKV